MKAQGADTRDLRPICVFDKAPPGVDDAGVRYQGHLPFEG